MAISQRQLRDAATKEWQLNYELERIDKPSLFQDDLWISYLAARTEYIVRQVTAVNYDMSEEE